MSMDEPKSASPRLTAHAEPILESGLNALDWNNLPVRLRPTAEDEGRMHDAESVRVTSASPRPAQE